MLLFWVQIVPEANVVICIRPPLSVGEIITEMVYTYDSAGGNNCDLVTNCDYSSLSTWESATDNDFANMKLSVLDSFGTGDSEAHFTDGVAVETAGAHTGFIRGEWNSDSHIIVETTDITVGEEILLTSNNSRTFTMTDLNSVTVITLEAYDSQNHNNTVNIAGASNTDSTHYRRIIAATGASPDFVITGGAVTAGININEGYVEINGLKIKRTNNDSGSSWGIRMQSGGGVWAKIYNTTIYDSINAGSANMGGINANAGNALLVNILVYNTETHGIQLSHADANTCYSCTVYGCGGWGFNEGAGDNIAFNSVADGNTTGDFDSGFGGTSSHNASGDTSSPVGNNIDNIVTADTWTDAGAGDFTIKDVNSDLYQAGIDKSADTGLSTDIVGTTWLDPPSIGAYEFVP